MTDAKTAQTGSNLKYIMTLLSHSMSPILFVSCDDSIYKIKNTVPNALNLQSISL